MYLVVGCCSVGSGCGNTMERFCLGGGGVCLQGRMACCSVGICLGGNVGLLSVAKDCVVAVVLVFVVVVLVVVRVEGCDVVVSVRLMKVYG